MQKIVRELRVREIIMEGICNNRCKLTFHRQSMRGFIQDFIITFNDIETSIEEVIEDTYDLFNKLMDKFKDKAVKARLIATIEFASVRDGEEIELRTYHFTSYQAEYVTDDRKEFFKRHILKIASRLTDFNKNGSNLIMKRISACHVAISVS